MSPEIVGVIGIALLLLFMFMGMWLGGAMAIVGFLGFAILADTESALNILGSVPYSTVANETMAVVPLFVFMGVLVSNTGVAGDLYRTAYKWLGHFRGGLAMSTIVACGGFAAISGSSTAAAATMGKVAIPEMKKYRYSERLTAGAVAAGGTIGILIPPSMGFMMYGILTEESIGRLFMAGIIPGLLEIAFYVGTIAILCGVRPEMGPTGPKTSLVEKIKSLKDTWAILALFILVMGGIYGGWFTTTEAGAIGAFGAVVISFIAGRLDRKNLVSSILEAAQNTAMMILMLASTFVFMKFMTISQLPSWLAHQITSIDLPAVGIMMLIILMYVFMGMFLDIMTALILTIPIIFPVVMSLGFDPIWYGVIMVRVMEIGMITPPMGINVFILSGVTKIPAKTIFMGIAPFVVADVLHVLLLLFFPAISLFLPNMM
jgi:tripartite ATP-independent transporter DctM subunit